jgi:hypothetical protein
MKTFTFEIDNQPDLKSAEVENYEAFDVEVEYTVSPYDPGLWSYSNGDPGYPPSGGEVEDMKVFRDGVDISDNILPRWNDILFEECIKHSENND